MERIIDVAQYAYDYYYDISNEKISEMKLQKILYLIQRESYAILDKTMFEEDFEGWVQGPVSRDVRFNYDDGIICSTKPIFKDNTIIAQKVIITYGLYDTWYLRNLMYEELSWKNSRIGLKRNQPGNRIISKSDIALDAQKVKSIEKDSSLL